MDDPYPYGFGIDPETLVVAHGTGADALINALHGNRRDEGARECLYTVYAHGERSFLVEAKALFQAHYVIRCEVGNPAGCRLLLRSAGVSYIHPSIEIVNFWLSCSSAERDASLVYESGLCIVFHVCRLL